MQLHWQIEDQDIQIVSELVNHFQTHQYVLDRQSRNVQQEGIQPVMRETFWHAMLLGLLTTQQRSGTGSRVDNFLGLSPHPLRLEVCINQENLESYSKSLLKNFRRNEIISKHLVENLNKLETDQWNIINRLNYSLPCKEIQTERFLANEVAKLLKGIGPKQSRNMLQNLGLTRYEIPLDSRVIGWINEQTNFFPIKLKSTGLSDPNYYEFVLDGIQLLCAKADILPCIFDAAAFASAEK